MNVVIDTALLIGNWIAFPRKSRYLRKAKFQDAEPDMEVVCRERVNSQ